MGDFARFLNGCYNHNVLGVSRWALHHAGYANKTILTRNINDRSHNLSANNIQAFHYALSHGEIINSRANAQLQNIGTRDVNLVWGRKKMQRDFEELITPDLYGRSMKYSALSIAKGLCWTAGKTFEGG